MPSPAAGCALGCKNSWLVSRARWLAARRIKKKTMRKRCCAATTMIRVYQRWVRPALPASCRFYPSCSEYAVVALERHGLIRGLGLTIWRLLRCHPYHPGGLDPVP